MIEDLAVDDARTAPTGVGNLARTTITLVVLWAVFLVGLHNYIASYSLNRFSAWNVGDWLINYQGGFVRRGFLGEVFYLLSARFAHLSAPLMVYAVQISLYLIIAVGITYMAWGSRSRWLPWILLSPAGLLFVTYAPQGGFRKEEFAFASLVLLGSSLKLHGRWKNVAIVAGLALYVLLLLAWEAGVFFLPPVIWLLWYAQRPDMNKFRKTAIWVAALTALIVGASILFHGNQQTVSGICTSWTVQGLPKSLCDGAIVAIGRSLSGNMAILGRDFPMYDFYAFWFALSFLPFFLSGWARRFRYPLAISILAVGPLFVISTDYGRWIHSLVLCLSIVWLADPGEPKKRPAALTVLELPVLAAWALLWSVPYFGPPHNYTTLVAVVRALHLG